MTVYKVPAKNITMVAYLDKMPAQVTTIISGIHERISDLRLPDGTFVPYKPNELHATLLGMEVLKIDGEVVNANFLNNNGRICSSQPLQLLSLLDAVVSSRKSVFTIRFGGFSQAQCKCAGFDLLDWQCTNPIAEFHAFNRTAYEGSFYAFPTGPVMLTGWPINPPSLDSFPRELYGLRHAAEDCGFLDKYHTTEKLHWKDDDFYIRVGTFRNFPANQFQGLIDQVRDDIAGVNPVRPAEVTVADIEFVYYKRATPLVVIDRLPLQHALTNPRKLLAMYDRWTYEN